MALEREAELRGTKLPDKTFDDALKRYEAEVGEPIAANLPVPVAVPKWQLTPQGA